MRAITKYLLAGIFFLGASLVSGVGAETPASLCQPDGTQTSGAKYRICMPAEGTWNGDLVLYAHGYVAFNEPIGIPEDLLSLPGGASLPEIVNGLGFAFAVTSYSKNGLAVVEGMNDLVALAAIFEATNGPPGRTYLVGASNGGIITALSLERHPDLYSGGLAACGPIGNFRGQINYLGDFRVAFDYFFPGVLPGKADSIPTELIEGWEAVYVPAVRAAIAAAPDKVRQLLRVTKAPVGLDPSSVEETVLGVLWYNVFGTNDAKQVLGGQPFDNRLRWYSGSDNDLRLNLRVDRFDADTAALLEIEETYQTSGALSRPVVTMHTVGDQIIPYGHEPLYRRKVGLAGADSLHDNIPILRYGHCNFTAGEALFGFGLLVHRVTGEAMVGVSLSSAP